MAATGALKLRAVARVAVRRWRSAPRWISRALMANLIAALSLAPMAEGRPAQGFEPGAGRPAASAAGRVGQGEAGRMEAQRRLHLAQLPDSGRIQMPPGATERRYPSPGRIVRLPRRSDRDDSDSVSARLAADDCGADLCVGPDFFLKKPSEAAELMRPGESVHIQAAEYQDCAVWPYSVRIAGINGRPHIRDALCNGKAVWVVQGEETLISNVEISGGATGDGTGNAVRHEGESLVLDQVVVHGNQIGVLTNPGPDITLEIIDSEFYGQSNRAGLAHSVYANRIGELSVRGSYFHDGRSGHYLKTLAAKNDIRYNRFVDASGVNAHMVDVWGCSDSTIVGNAMMRVGNYGNLNILGITPRREYGELRPCPPGRRGQIRVVHNTAVFGGHGPRWSSFVNVKFDVPVIVQGNLGVQLGRLVEPGDTARRLQASGAMSGNVSFRELGRADELFRDWRSGDLRLKTSVRKPAVAGTADVEVSAEPQYPLGMIPRGDLTDAGAHAYRGGP